MDEPNSLANWWQNERTKQLNRLREKSKTEPLSEVEMMILTPFSLDQARNQVIMFNGSNITNPSCSEPKKL